MSRVPLHPLTVPVVLVLLVWWSDTDEVSADMVVVPLLLVLLASVAMTLAGTAIVREWRRGALIGTAASILWLFHGPFWDVLPGSVPLWGRVAVVVVLVTGVGVWSVRADDEQLGRTTRTSNALGILAVVGLAVPIVTSVTFAQAAPIPVPDVSGRDTLPDIVWIVPDRYGSAAALERRFGIDSSPFERALAKRGFSVAADARANYPRTVMSLAAMLNLSYLDASVRDLPSSADASVTPLYPLLQDHAVGRLLRGLGYDYVHIGNWWSPTKDAVAATEVRSAGQSTEFGRVIERVTMGPSLGLRVSDLPLSHRSLHEVTNRTGLDTLEREMHELAEDAEDAPRFVFAHIALPHEPYVFDVDGSPLDQASAGAGRTEAEAFDRQRRYLDDRLLAIIDAAPLPEDGGPMIMLLADEGPHPLHYDSRSWVWENADEAALVSKLSILAAVRGHRADSVDLPHGVTGVNVARSFVADALGAELPALVDRSFIYRSPGAVHEYVDVTERLNQALGPAAGSDGSTG